MWGSQYLNSLLFGIFLFFRFFFASLQKINYLQNLLRLNHLLCMPNGIGKDASVVLVVFLFNSDSFPIIFDKLKKTHNGRLDGQTDGRVNLEE